MHSGKARARSPRASMLLGALLVVCGVTLCLWNELRPALVSSSDADAVATHVSGVLQPAGDVEDPAFGLRSRSLALRRTVEIFRAKGAAEQLRTTSRGSWIASADAPGSDGRAARDSVAPAFAGETWHAGLVTLEGLQVDAEIVAAIDGWQPLAMDERDLAPNLAATFVLVGGKLLSSADPAAPQDGDLRISWSHVPTQHVSVTAQKSQERLEPLDPAFWNRPFVLAPGPVDEAAMPPVDRVRQQAGVLTAIWPVRMLAFGLLWLGLHLLFRPLRSLMKPVPLLGRMASGALWTGSLATAMVVMLVLTLAIGLLVQR